MSCGFGLWGSSFSTNPAFAVDLSAASTPAIRSQARHIVSDQLSSKHPVPTPAVFDSSEASIAYGSRGVLHNIEVLSSFAEFGFDDPEKKCSHVKLLRDQLCNSLVVGDALKHNVVPLMATLVKDSGTAPPRPRPSTPQHCFAPVLVCPRNQMHSQLLVCVLIPLQTPALSLLPLPFWNGWRLFE